MGIFPQNLGRKFYSLNLICCKPGLYTDEVTEIKIVLKSVKIKIFLGKFELKLSHLTV